MVQPSEREISCPDAKRLPRATYTDGQVGRDGGQKKRPPPLGSRGVCHLRVLDCSMHGLRGMVTAYRESLLRLDWTRDGLTTFHITAGGWIPKFSSPAGGGGSEGRGTAPYPQISWIG